jgi:hypothetical protein
MPADKRCRPLLRDDRQEPLPIYFNHLEQDLRYLSEDAVIKQLTKILKICAGTFSTKRVREGSRDGLDNDRIETACRDFDQSFVLAIDRMEVRRLVVAVKHPNNDSEKAAQLGHGLTSFILHL